LYLLPSLGLGIVGLGRYSGECFPVAIACGVALEAAPRILLKGVLIASMAVMATVAFVITAQGLVP
jgi:NADH:ubiquinone oxidoreductase subunit F (NADH-binding)